MTAEEKATGSDDIKSDEEQIDPSSATFKSLTTRFDSVLKLLKNAESEISSKSDSHLIESLKKEISTMKLETNALKRNYGSLKWSQVCADGYPQARRDAKCINEYENAAGQKVQVNDAYEWLEDPDCAESREWIYEQVRVCNAYLDSVCGNVDQIYKELEKNINFPRYSTPSKKGNIYYYTYNSGLQNQSVLYYHSGSLDNEQKLLIDPNTLSKDGTTSLKGRYFSEDGKYLCYGLSEKGSDWTEYRVMEVESGKHLKDHLKWCKFTGITWLKDGSGFFYSRYKAPDHAGNDNTNQSDAGASKSKSKGTETEKLKNQQLYYHKLGTDQSEDVFLIDAVTLGDEEWMPALGITYDGAYLELYISFSCDPLNKLYLIPLKTGGSNKSVYESAELFQSSMIKLVDNFDFGYDIIYNENTLFYFKTNNNASNYRIVTFDIANFSPTFTDKTQDDPKFQEFIKEEKFRLDCVKAVALGKYLLLDYNQDVKTVLSLVDIKTGQEVKNNIKFPAAGCIYWTASPKHNEAFFYFTSFLYPGTIFTYDFSVDKMNEWKAITVPGFDSNDYNTKQVFYSSKDGTKIPMYILSPKGLEMNGDNPTILYGYGGFDISLMPGFRVTRVLWLKHTGGVYCVANLRGGGEYGEKWHKAGCKHLKQNVFDDFHSASEYLIESKYTNNKRLAIEGGSNGGLLVAACLNQRPDLYRCGVANCGVLDMLKFHKFTIGYAWCSDYGSADIPKEFDAIYKYAPILNIPKEKTNVNQYPAVMTTTADHDDRVSPLHTFKFMAQLQHQNPKNVNPILTRIDVRSGHGSSSLTKGIEARADTFAFIANCLNAKWN